jgi:hypothetical protein
MKSRRADCGNGAIGGDVQWPTPLDGVHDFVHDVVFLVPNDDRVARALQSSADGMNARGCVPFGGHPHAKRSFNAGGCLAISQLRTTRLPER